MCSLWQGGILHQVRLTQGVMWKRRSVVETQGLGARSESPALIGH